MTTIPLRIRLLAGLFLLIFGFWLWNWVSGWGLVTVRAYDDSFGNIQRSIERQGRIKIVSNVPPETKLSMEVVKVSPVEAVNVLAARVDGRCSITFIVAPDNAGVRAGGESLRSSERNPAFRLLRVRGWGDEMFNSPPDLRKVRWNVSTMDEKSLQTYLDQIVQKTGVSVLIAADWNPSVSKEPKSAEAGVSLRSLVSSVGGKVEEVFAVTTQPDDASSGRDRADGGDGPPWGGGGNPSGGGGNPSGGGGGGNRNPAGAPGAVSDSAGSPNAGSERAWADERVKAQIELLPPEQREIAKNDYDELQKFFAGVRQLPVDQRRAAIEERISNPAMQERMLERETTRDMNRGPERRVARYKRSIEQKQAYRNGQQN